MIGSEVREYVNTEAWAIVSFDMEREEIASLEVYEDKTRAVEEFLEDFSRDKEMEPGCDESFQALADKEYWVGAVKVELMKTRVEAEIPF